MKNVVFVSGQRGTPKLVVEGYSFVRNRGNSLKTYWRCSKMRSNHCKAKVVTSKGKTRICVKNKHNHSPDYSQFIE